MAEVIAVLTYKSVDTILRTGGTQSWALQRSRARACKYVVVHRNAHNPDVEGDEPHGTAFMVGKIKDVVPSTDHDGRWLILMSEYAVIPPRDTWSGRNPVAYWSEEDYEGLDFSRLEFLPMPDKPEAAKAVGLSIEEAKQGLAERFGVPVQAIEVTIRA